MAGHNRRRRAPAAPPHLPGHYSLQTPRAQLRASQTAPDSPEHIGRRRRSVPPVHYREEAGEARLGVAHPSLAPFERPLSAAEAEQLAGGAERVEVTALELRRHGSHSAPWNRSATP